jgi:hypothetical protein
LTLGYLRVLLVQLADLQELLHLCLHNNLFTYVPVPRRAVSGHLVDKPFIVVGKDVVVPIILRPSQCAER